MKKTLLALSFLVMAPLASAAVIITDMNSFYSRFGNKQGELSFQKYPEWLGYGPNTGSTVLHSEDWKPGIGVAILTVHGRNPNAGGFGWGAHQWNVETHEISADYNAYGEYSALAIELYRPQKTLAIYTTNGFFGWVPELGTTKDEDGGLYFPVGVNITKIEYGFTPITAPVSEPETYALMGLGLLGLLAANRRTSKK